MRRLLSLSVVGVALAVAMACGGGGGSSPTAPSGGGGTGGGGTGGTGGATVARDQSLYTLGHTPSAELLEQHLERFGAYAPAWDVAAPCDDEDEGRVMREAFRRAAGLDTGSHTSGSSPRCDTT